MFAINGPDKVKIILYGKEYQVSRPSMGQLEKMQDDLDAVGKEDDVAGRGSLKVIKSFMLSLGVPGDELKRLTLDQIHELQEHVIASKKKDNSA